jgi:hypothetical protein
MVGSPFGIGSDLFHRKWLPDYLLASDRFPPPKGGDPSVHQNQ